MAAFVESLRVAGCGDVGGAAGWGWYCARMAGEWQDGFACGAQAAGGAGDGGLRVRDDVSEGVETRGEIGRGDEAFPFVIAPAPVCEAFGQGVGIVRLARA